MKIIQLKEEDDSPIIQKIELIKQHTGLKTDTSVLRFAVIQTVKEMEEQI